MERKNQVFQQLKPVCVHLSQAVLRVESNVGNSKDVVRALSELLDVLKSITAHDSHALDGKLAEYVFFPMTHVLRDKQKFSLHALELTLSCLSILLRSGWRLVVDPQLCRQFLILLPVLAAGNPSDIAPMESSEEVQAAALECLSELFTTYSSSAAGKQSLVEISNVPPLGHAVTVILDGISKSSSLHVQRAAVDALHSCCNAIGDRDTLASFFPGIVSTLANVLTPSTKSRRPYKLLQRSLEILSELFKRVISDEQTRNIPESVQAKNKQSQPLTTAWLNATAAQVKLALANVVRTRQHERKEVRQALLTLCLTVLEDCRLSLQDSAAMMIETMTVLCGTDDQDGIRRTIQHVLTSDHRVADLLRTSLHTWTVSLPRVMQSPDDAAKQKLIEQIDNGYQLLSGQGLDLTIIDRAITSNIRDSIVGSVLEQSRVGDLGSTSMSLELAAPSESGHAVTFGPVLTGHKSQQDTVAQIHHLIDHVGSSSSSLNATRELTDSLYSSKGPSQIAAFWTALNLLKSSISHNSAIDDFLDLGDSGSKIREELLEELYSYSIEILQSQEIERQQDWRLQALALEAIAFQATSMKGGFSIELVDALYPVVHLVGSPIPELRHHAIITLNILASECGFSSVSDLIVSNVDYLVNAVGLKLNTFDISPQVPQVLLMMVKLTGPSLLPYLDDLVGSIFSALECFHGYPKLVELLFAVLKGIAEEGTKNPQLAITDGSSVSKHKDALKRLEVKDVVKLLRHMKEKEAERAQKDDEEDVKEAFPRKPWKEDEEKEDPTDDPLTTDPMDEEPPPETPEPPPPAPKTYDLLLKISQLAQHYLTSSSPTLRTSLLSLLNTTFPALAKHENSFLPLINTLWPALAARLDDTEAYVLADTMDVIGAMCVHTGDFMRGRVESIWPRLKELYRNGGIRGTAERSLASAPAGPRRQTARQMIESAASASAPGQSAGTSSEGAFGGSGALQGYYVDAPTRIIRTHFFKLVVAIVDNLAIEEDMFDEVMELLGPILEIQTAVRESLERKNSDAVWLALLKLRVGRMNKEEDELADIMREPPGLVNGRSFVSIVV
ncbi:ARM repeat-containing protein [Saccharata proteae CBS 121410]|uniref:ARM repeat-containing protein n=1 Tax=Saccharata proteae CBS 121410 TaxID=1314787 RepID=A0A9P4HM14_9PEZI|nr:ARM repeat-containing protein [Saccharata proteae CBS 121410]